MNQLKIRRFAPLGYTRQEAVNTLCTNLSFSGENIKRIMITSSHSSEGKSFLSMNIMRTFANYGKKVALVEADLRKNCIASHYKLEYANQDGAGLAHYLSGLAEVNDVLYQTDIPGAFIVPAGRNVSNPIALLTSPRFRELMEYLTSVVDYVLVDAPPVIPVIDTAEIAKSCDGTLLVVSYNAVHRQELMEAKERLEQTGCPIIGAALNQVEIGNDFNKKYYQYDSYFTAKYKRKNIRAKGKHIAERK